MLINAIHNQGRILEAALQASSARNDAILNNIANNDVPGYKAKTVDFEQSLIDALNNWEKTGVLDLSSAKPTLRTQDKNFSYRLDKNNVDIELEMVKLYQNSIRYEVMINSLLNNSRNMSTVLSGR